MRLSHFPALVIFALIVSAVFAMITKNTPQRTIPLRRYFVFFSFLFVAIVVGWLMYPLPL